MKLLFWKKDRTGRIISALLGYQKELYDLRGSENNIVCMTSSSGHSRTTIGEQDKLDLLIEKMRRFIRRTYPDYQDRLSSFERGLINCDINGEKCANEIRYLDRFILATLEEFEIFGNDFTPIGPSKKESEIGLDRAGPSYKKRTSQ